MTVIISQCYWCKHYQDDGKCEAFGDKKIPHDIFFNMHDHKLPYKGDHGIQFEPEKEGEVPVIESPENPWLMS